MKKNYQFNSRASTNELLLLKESLSFEKMKYSENQSYKILTQPTMNYQSYNAMIEDRDGFLVDNTP